jgi:hypothetical protein
MASSGHNITYLFGAGASFNALPVVDEFPEAISNIIEIANSSISILNNDEQNSIKEFVAELEALLLISNDFNTIDTYARKLVLSGKNEKLTKLKITLSIFFELWQSWKQRLLWSAAKTVENTSITGRKDYVDKRYTTLFSNLLEQDKGGLKIPENINFLTWNYDTQIARAINLFAEREDLSEIYSDFNFYPQLNRNRNQQYAKVVHLNGVAGLYNLTKDGSVNSIIDRVKGKPDFVNAILELLFVYDSYKKRQISFENTYSFAWENSETVYLGREIARQILQKTNVLVIIGYSFPTFNLNVDRELMEAFKLKSNENELKRIIYQDISANKEIIRDSFDISESQIITREDINQFILPRQFM